MSDRARVRLGRGRPLWGEPLVDSRPETGRMSTSGYWRVVCEQLPGLSIYRGRWPTRQLWSYLVVTGDDDPVPYATYAFLSRHQLTDARFPTRRAAVAALEVAMDMDGLLR